ncbi:hypothetical protein RDABS01_006376 [Bienertia sinuspersici]
MNVEEDDDNEGINEDSLALVDDDFDPYDGSLCDGEEEGNYFAKLYRNGELTTNPGSKAICAWNSVDHVDRPLAFTTIFIASKGAIEGLFGGCRSFVGIDGTFLKGNYGGVLLSAVALDGNNRLFSFAWAIISSEDSENWRFVIWHLKNVLKDSDRGDEWCIKSDRHHGIENALSELWPSVGRRYCCKHLCGSWKKVFPGPLMFSLFWKSCGAYSKFTFAKAMEQLQKTNPEALIWLSKVGDQERWTNMHSILLSSVM